MTVRPHQTARPHHVRVQVNLWYDREPSLDELGIVFDRIRSTTMTLDADHEVWLDTVTTHCYSQHSGQGVDL